MTASTTSHCYSIYLKSTDPSINQPETILKDLKPHQLTAIYKCIEMESKPHINYNVPISENSIRFTNNIPTFENYFQMNTNVGIIGDIVGYGKTLIALTIIQTNPIQQIYSNPHQIYSYGSVYYSGNITVHQEKLYKVPINSYIHTTIVIVPRGPVYIQWKKSIEQDTSLRYLYIDSLHTIRKVLPQTELELKSFLESYDLILIKNTTLKVWFEYLKNLETPIIIQGFDRIIIDEAHELSYKIPGINFKFLWLITSNYTELMNHTHTRCIHNHFSLLTNLERIHYMLIKNETRYILQSFNLPEPIENYYLCRMDKNISALTGFVSASVLDKINVNDITGAIHELGGIQETETSLIETVEKDFLKDIHNKEKEIEFIKTLQLDVDQREHRIKNVTLELNRLKERYSSLQERLSGLTSKTCPICMDLLDNPLYLNCTHTICGKCLFNWANSSIHTRNSVIHCPECRTPIDSNKIVAIVKNNRNIKTAPQLLSKEEQFLKIIEQKPEGRFLLFSRMDSQFYHLCSLLTSKHISYSEMKGSTSHMMSILKNFNEGNIKVILLNTNYAGFGIDINTATDVIIYHKMPNEKSQAVGRAQRVGRTETLTIHNLCYSHELNNVNK